MGLDTLGQNFAEQGLMPGYLRGQAQGATVGKSLADTAQTQAQTNRYTAQTADSNAQMGYKTEADRLGNLPGKAGEAVGLPAAQAQTSLDQAKLSAAQAKAKYEQLPIDVQNELHDKIHKQSMSFMTQARDMLISGTPVQKTFDWMLQQYPQMANDPQAIQLMGQYKNANPQTAAGEITQIMNRMAYAGATAAPEQQGKLQVHDIDNTSAEKIAAGHDAATLERTNAMVTGRAQGKPTADQFLYEKYKAANPDLSEGDLAAGYLDWKTTTIKKNPSLLSDSGYTEATTSRPPAGKGNPSTNASKTIHIPTEDWAKLKQYPSLIGRYEQEHGIQAGWISNQLKGK
jgi:hypothetical protein